MSKAKRHQNVGGEFVSLQRAVDQAKNEKIKSDESTNKLDPQKANRQANRSHKTDVSRKKTGGGKQISPGT